MKYAAQEDLSPDFSCVGLKSRVLDAPYEEQAGKSLCWSEFCWLCAIDTTMIEISTDWFT